MSTPLADNALRDSLRTLRAEAAVRSEADSLPSAAQVRSRVGINSWVGLDPVDAFLVFEIAPDVADAAPAAQRAAAYCAALRALPPDWWGLPYAFRTDAARHLIALGPAAAGCLAPLLGDPTPLRYRDGESNTMARDLAWTVGDLAAAAAAAITAQPWNGRASAAIRAADRRVLAERLAGGR